MSKKYIVLIAICSILFVFSTALNFAVNLNNKNRIKNDVVVINAILPTLSIDDLKDKSSLIIKGTVTKVMPSQRTNVRNNTKNQKPGCISTDYVLNISEVLKGTNRNLENINVRILKGNIGEEKVISDAIPNFTLQEDVLLFLAKDDSDFAYSDEDYYILTGWALGKYTFDKSGQYFYNEYNDYKLTKNDLIQLSK